MTQSIQNKKRQKLYTQKQKKKETSNYIKTTHTSESSNMSSSTEVKDRHFLITSTGAQGNQTQVCQVNPTVCLNRWSMAAYQFQVQMTTSRSLNTLPDATYSSQSEWHVGHLGGHLLQASHFKLFFSGKQTSSNFTTFSRQFTSFSCSKYYKTAVQNVPLSVSVTGYTNGTRKGRVTTPYGKTVLIKIWLVTSDW